MRILICDDDKLMLEQLTNYLHEYFQKNRLPLPELSIYASGEALLADTGEMDIVFLDVEMPGISGITTGKRLKEKHPKVLIFIVTSFAEYLDEAMRFQVFRYLSKPLDKQRLFRNLKDALQFYHTSHIRIAVETKDGIHMTDTPDIVSIETQGRKVVVHTVTADYESVHPMRYWVDTLNIPCFFQPHKSFLVNLGHVTDFDHSMISLDHGKYHAYLTRRRYSQFKNAYLLYLENIQ